MPLFLDWFVFAAILFPLLAIDLWFQREGRGSEKKSALVWSIIWIGVGLLFSLYIHYRWDDNASKEYIAAYLIEKSLSADNLFVFLLIFRSMRIPHRYQRTALAWGIFGALVFRGIFVFAGIAALERWAWVEYVFAALLAYAAIHSIRGVEQQESEENRLLQWLGRHLPVSKARETSHFFLREEGKLKVTPILLTILALETTDIIFAIDSVPAALAISRDQFIVYSSNAFAILGLRALYILLAGIISNLRYLHYGLAAVLGFAAFKMVAPESLQISALGSVLIIAAVIGLAAIVSVLHPERPEPE